MASLTLKQHTAQDKKLTEISKEITLDGALLSQAQHLVIVTTKWNLVILFLASNCPAKSRLRIIPSTSAKKALAEKLRSLTEFWKTVLKEGSSLAALLKIFV